MFLCWFITLHPVGRSIFKPVSDARKSDVQRETQVNKRQGKQTEASWGLAAFSVLGRETRAVAERNTWYKS